jgi:N6-adenosine-specific RNA methylase IME4
MTNALVKLEKARTLLVQARSLPEVLRVRGLAEAAAMYARKAHLGREAQNFAGEIALRAAIKAGEILEKLDKSDGGRPQKKTQPAAVRVSEYAKVLKETNTAKTTAVRWQKIANKSLVPDSLVAEYVASCRASGEVTMTGLLREAIHRQRARLQADPPTMPTGVYRVLYADPPWDYGNPIAQGYGPAENHYPTMSLDELCAMKLPEIAPNAVLLIWVPAAFMLLSGKVISAWGFEYKTNIVWNKVRHTWGYYTSARHEHLSICTRGSCLPGPKFNSVQTIERSSRHSEKPEQFREIIDLMYPPPARGRNDRIELFARERPPARWDWSGNEVEPMLEVT